MKKLDVNKILKYKVLKESRKNKELFNGWLKDGFIEIRGYFQNEYGEMFVLFNVKRTREIIGITGDEFGWTIGYVCNDKGDVVKPFMLNDKEVKKIKEIFNENIR